MSSLREPSRRLPRASTVSSAGVSASTRTGAVGRASARPAVRASATSTRTRTNHHSTMASRIDRSGAASPAGSVSSMATTLTTGTKRKERDYEAAEVGLGEKTNINVVVRCRGRNDREVRENSAVVVSTEGVRGNVVDLSMGPNALSNKTYNFDRVFSSAADQGMIFDDVVKPILDEMLSGYNCTIFAYGQTGTGKTYTMTGDMNETMGMLSDAAGIIPRVLQTLFNKLEIEESDNCVRCSFIELYNEELRDLLSADDAAKLRIYEDNAKKSTVVQGMEERHIVTAAEGIKRLQEGSLRRQVAATKCNDLSSRSHTIFTITVYVKRPGENGDDYVSAGKLNLVDLAGSENIQRSGAENKRAAEAGLINKSLLTLGRVINSLVDQGTHIPYRESKLTRLLQDSLGGRTKTCIIATISPAKSNLEETISTLDYAFRAKDIRNKPQIRTLMSKKTLLREFTAEIEKLRGELVTTRQRNGVYLSNEAYEEITVQNESRRILTEEQSAKIGTIEANLRGKVQELFDLTSSFMGLKKEHEGTRAQLDDTKELLEQTDLVLSATRKNLADETYLRKAHQETEEKLANIGTELIDTLDETVEHVSGLRAKNKRKSDLQSLNRSTWALSQGQVAHVTELVEGRISEFQKDQEEHISSMSDRMQTFVQSELRKLSDTQTLLNENLGRFEVSQQELLEHKEQSKEEMDAVLEEIKEVRDHIKERVGESLEAIASAAERIAADVLSELGLFHSQLHTSYSTLGKDFKTVFEDLVRHLGAQRSESDRLRRQLEGASELLIQSNAATSARIQEIVAEEKRKAADERKELLAQITQLVNTQGETQELRLSEKTALLNQDLLDSTKAFEGSVMQYSDGMGSWVEKDGQIMGDINKSRDNMKTKLKDDWATANKHSTSIQATTKSVHAETVRVVEEQKRDLDVQMQDLDSFVTRARSQNSLHHSQNAASVQRLSQTVKCSYAEIASHSKDAVERVRELGEEVDADVDELRAGLEPLDEKVCQPLGNLRESIKDTLLQEYQPTGDTPEKTHYTYPTELPRTAPHEALLAELNGGGVVETPSKSAPAPPMVFNDFDETTTTVKRESSPSTSSAISSGLREMNPNVSVTTSAIQFNPSASTMSLAPLSGTDVNNNSTMPVFRRSTRSVSHNKDILSKSSIGSKPASIVAGIDGRENVPPVGGFAASGRRKSPRLR